MPYDPLEDLFNSTAGVDEETENLIEQRDAIREETIQDLGGRPLEEEISTEEQTTQQPESSTEDSPETEGTTEEVVDENNLPEGYYHHSELGVVHEDNLPKGYFVRNGDVYRNATTAEVIEKFKNPGELIRGGLQHWANQEPSWKTPADWPAAAGAGVLDFGIGLVNKVTPGNFDIPELPKYRSEGLQAVRDISSVVVPSIYIAKGLGAAGTAAHSKVGWKLGNDAFVKWVSNAGIAGLSGVIADEVAPVQERDHNALGMLKKSWPQTWGWVSDDWATLDEDEPDVKRAKNRNEGLGIGFLSDVVLSAGKLAKALKGVDRATQWVPENEKAANIIKAMQEPKLADDALENATLQSAKRRYDQTTEFGDVQISKDIDLDNPVLGVHDVYDYSESGFRTGDPSGIFGASIDVVKIEKNIDSIYGRVGSVVTPGAMDFLTNGNDAGMKLVKHAADLLKDSKYGYNASNGKFISHSEILESGKKLASELYEMDVSEMDKLLKGMSGIDPDSGVRVLTSEAYSGVMQAIRQYSDDFINMDIARAQAYIGTSMAGQVSDMAEGARLINGQEASVKRAQEQILDRLQYLMQAKGVTSYSRGRALNMLNLWNRVNKKSLKAEDAITAIKNEQNNTLKALARIENEAKSTIDTLRAVKNDRPDLLGPLMLAYEITDGKVSSITKLNEYVRNTTGVVKKAFFDGNVEMPSAWTQGMWANIYNSVLSSIGTPLKAGASNVALMVERPIATFAGALIQGDRDVLRRGKYMYTVGMVDTLQKAFGHMNQVFRRASQDPSSVGYVMRDDIARKNTDQMTLLRSFADAEEAQGNFGPSAMVNQIEAMNDLAEHPWLRFSANAMTAFDGFTRSFIANVEARGRAYDTLMSTGKEFQADDLKKISDGVYANMFDDKGFITDKAVEFASREIAMNLNTKEVDAVNTIIKRVPALKPFLMFPKTSMNMLQFAGTHNPLGLFVKDWNAFKTSVADGVPEAKLDELLSARGIPLDENKYIAYDTIRAELKGRKAIGTLTVMGAAGLFATDRLRGNGIYDKTRQKLRREAGWKPRTYKGLDGKWYSYENMGALSDWLALTADIMDNFDTLDEPSLELMLNKVGFLISANLTNKSFTAGLEPLNDVLAGNPAALSRWGASFGSSFVPGSGFRNEFGRLLEPQLKEVEQEFGQLLANRNAFAKSSLPDLYDWIDGGKVGEPTNFFTRVWNTYTPWMKQSDGLSPEKQFLVDIEFDGRPSLRTNGRGVEYTPDQRSEVTQIMGKDKAFKGELQRIMNSREGKDFRKAYKDAQRLGIPLDRTKFRRLHIQINSALRRAQTYAESRISGRTDVQKKQYLNRQIEQYTKTGETEKIKNLLNNRNK